MKKILLIPVIAFVIVSCGTSRQMAASTPVEQYEDTLITQSLFSDRSATISEDNIQRILEGNYKLPSHLRVSFVKLESPQQRRSFWNDEDYLKTQQAYLDSFASQFRRSPRVSSISTIPDMVISKSPTFTNIREAAVRLQSDIVVIYSITSDVYSKFKVFSNPDIKAFATTQLIILDVRTGLIPFSTIATKDFQSKKQKGELEFAESRNRIQHEAVLLTIHDISEKIVDFLNKN